jgi:nicotinamide mononucleotide (NMN) deamidase PncC
VVYRNESKAQWLGIDRQLLDDPHVGPVSAPVTRLLAQRALALTSEADLAAAVTGHVGPGCPAQLDGQVFFCLAKQGSSVLFESSLQLKSAAPRDSDDLAGRAARLREATQWVLQQIIVGAKVFVV